MKLSSLAKKRIISGMAAIVVVVAFYLYSNYSIEQQLSPMTVVFAKEDIPPHTQITEGMVFERVIPSQSVPPNAVKNPQEVIGKWTVDGYGISKNSLLYHGKILETNEMPDAAVLNLEADEFAFPLLVDIETSSGNSLMPNSYVDLYFATDRTDSNKPFTGKMFERVRITSVKDSKTQHVFTSDNYTESKQNGGNNQVASSTSNPNAIAKLYTFAVTEEQLELLTKAKLLGNIIPVANGKSYEEEVIADENINPEAVIDISMKKVHDYIELNSHEQSSHEQSANTKELLELLEEIETADAGIPKDESVPVK